MLTRDLLGVLGTTASSTISDELRRAAFHINPKDIVIEQGEHGPVLLGKGAFGEARPCFSSYSNAPLLGCTGVACGDCHAPMKPSQCTTATSQPQSRLNYPNYTERPARHARSWRGKSLPAVYAAAAQTSCNRHSSLLLFVGSPQYLDKVVECWL